MASRPEPPGCGCRTPSGSASPYMVDDPAGHVLFSVEYFCSEGDAFWSMDDNAFIEKCIGELKAAGIISDETKILDAVHTRTVKGISGVFRKLRGVRQGARMAGRVLEPLLHRQKRPAPLQQHGPLHALRDRGRARTCERNRQARGLEREHGRGIPRIQVAHYNAHIGSGGWIRTSDQLINSQLRYHCATPEWSSGAYYTKIPPHGARGYFPAAFSAGERASVSAGRGRCRRTRPRPAFHPQARRSR